MAASAWPLVTQRRPGVRDPEAERRRAKTSEINGQGRRTLTRRLCTLGSGGFGGQQEWDGQPWTERRRVGRNRGPSDSGQRESDQKRFS